jgi:hypothetical protein
VGGAICLPFGSPLSKHIDSIIQRAEREADAIRREAERDAEDIRRDALEAAQRLLDRLLALEFPLGSLVADLREEIEEVARQLEAGGSAPSAPRSMSHEDSGPPAGGGNQPEDPEPVAPRQSRPARAREPEGWKRWVAGDAD